MNTTINFFGDSENPSDTVIGIEYSIEKPDGTMLAGKVLLDETFNALNHADAVKWVEDKVLVP